MKFPDNWPEDCPPDDADPANGDVYRIVKSNPVSTDDFLSHVELNRKLSKNTDKCLASGLSVFREKRDALNMLRNFKQLGSFIAKGTLQPDHGVTKQTGKASHTTWWSTVDVDRASLFADVEEFK